MTKKIILLIPAFLFGMIGLFAQTVPLDWQFANGSLNTSVSPMEYTFDVQIKSNAASTMVGGTLKITYSNAAFGILENTDVTITPGANFAGFFGKNKLVTGIAIRYEVSFGNGAITADYVTFCTIVVPVENSCELAGIDFIPDGMDGLSFVDPGTSFYVNNYVNDWTNQSLAPATTTWTGTTNSDWSDATNWSDGYPCTGTVVYIPDVPNYPIMDVDGFCADITINAGGKLTINSGNTLTVAGDFKVESGAGLVKSGANGSFINNGTLAVTGTSWVECYVTNGQWHGISAAVAGEDFTSMYSTTGPLVWVKEYTEATNTYDFITEETTPMGDMKGWFAWIDSESTDQTFTFGGSFRTGTVGTANNMVRANLGHNFVGNPFPSAIDWDAATGWAKTNLYGAIYVYNDGNWASYVGTTGVAGGSRYIAMNQGFFVQVATVGVGTLQMDEGVCVHNDVGFLKGQMAEQQTIRLEIEANGLVDETVVKFAEDATVDFDGNLDASKFFSFEEGYPQLYSTANNFMSINALPFEEMEGSIDMDVRGEDGSSMTITVTEAADFNELYLRDEYTGITTDLKTSSYTFTYDSSVSNRLSLFFSPTGIYDNPILNNVHIFAYDKNIKVELDGLSNVNITVYNLMGQKIDARSANTTTIIPVNRAGYYVVKVSDGVGVSTQKVFIK